MYKPKIMRTILYLTLLSAYLLIATTLFFLVWLVTLPFDRKRKAICALSYLYANGIMRLCPWWRIRVENREKIDPEKTYVIVINHRSMLDIPLINTLGLNQKWVSKKEILKMPFIGWVLRMRKDITIERGEVGSAKHMLAACEANLKQGISICLFPEGTRSKDGKLKRFKEGAFALALNSKTAILPIVTTGTWEATNHKGKGLKMPNTFTIRFMDEIPYDSFKDRTQKEITQEVHDRMDAELQRMAPEFYKEKHD